MSHAESANGNPGLDGLVASCEGVIFLSNDRAVTLPEGSGSLARVFGIVAMQVVAVAWIIGLVVPLISSLTRGQAFAVRIAVFVVGGFLTLFVAMLVVQGLYTLF